MGFLKSLFSGKVETAEEQKQNEDQRKFDILKFDGVKALKMHQMEQAERCFTAALEIKNDLETHDYLSQVFIQSGQLELAMQELNLLQRNEPDNQQLLMRMVQVAYMMENYPLMEQLCQQATAIEGSSDMFYYMHARAKQGMNQPEEALNLVEQALSKNENSLDARLLKVELLLSMGKNAEALAETQWLTERLPDNEEVLTLKAQALQANAHTEQAIETYGQVIELNPFSAQAYNQRAQLRKAIGDEAGAAEDLQEASLIQPDGNVEDIEQQMNQTYKDANPFG